MPKNLYDSWPQYLGQLLIVVMATEKFEGILIGLKPTRTPDAPMGAVEPPWTIMTLDGPVCVDPDNPAVAIYTKDGQIGQSRSAPPETLSSKNLRTFLERCEAIASANQERLRHVSQRKSGSGGL